MRLENCSFLKSDRIWSNSIFFLSSRKIRKNIILDQGKKVSKVEKFCIDFQNFKDY